MKSAPVILGTVLFLATAVFPAVSARGELIVHENFDYAAGPLDGQNGGVGFAGAWSTTVWEVRSGSLSFPAVSPTGNYVQDTGSYPAEAQRLLRTPINFDTEGIHYLSVLLNKTDGGNASAEPLMVYLAQGSAAAASLGITSSEKLMVGADKTSLFTAGPAVPASTTVLAVLKLATHADAPDQYYGWVFEPGETIPVTEPTTWDCSYSSSVAGIVCDRLGMLSGNAIGSIDEIRLATTWGEVAPAPEPGAGLLLLVGLAGLVLLQTATTRKGGNAAQLP